MVRRNITHRDVAQKAGVSSTTVSFVLNGRTKANISEDTKQRVLEAARILGYTPSAAAQALRFGRSQTIGFVLESSKYYPSFVGSELIYGILSVASRHNLRLLVDQVDESNHNGSYLSLAQAKSIDGLIIPEPAFNDPNIEYLSNYNFPVVVLGNLDGSRLSTIDFDNYGGARDVMAHLLSLGHTRIACMTHTSKLNATGLIERFNGYKDGLKAANLPFEERLVRYGKDTVQSGFEMMLNLLDEDVLPTAVFCLNDNMALGAMAAIEERGLNIPDQIAVAGFDDSPFAPFLNPSLTSVKLPFEELGRIAGEMLVGLVEEHTESGQHIKIPVQLNVRKSTDPKLAGVNGKIPQSFRR